MLHRARTVRATTASAVLASLVAASALLGPQAHAADGDEAGADGEGRSWSVVPVPPKGKTAAPRSYFILEGDPGTVIKDEVLVQNWTDHPITFELFGADGYNTDGEGAFALRSRGDEQVDLGRWTRPGVKRITIYGRTAAKVPVKFKIPDNATPGDHVGGVVALNTAVETKTRGAVQVGIQRAVAARAYVRVSGNLSPGLEVRDVEVTHDRGGWPWSGRGHGTVSWTVVNTGNTRLSPTGTLEVNGLGADHSVDLKPLTDLLPGSEVRMTQEIEHVPGIGPVEVEVELVAGEDLVARDRASFTLVPWPFVTLLGVLLLSVAAVVARRRSTLRRRLRDAGEAPRITVGSRP